MMVYSDEFIHNKRFGLYIMGRNVMGTAEAEQRYGAKFESCPFCKNPFPGIRFSRSESGICQCICGFCGCEGPEAEHPMMAIRLWNNREPLQRYEQKPYVTPKPKK